MTSEEPPGKLSPLQERILVEFFARDQGFFLTGGAALAGFHLHHRSTDDLDLFTTDAAVFERARYVLADVASSLELAITVVQDAPGFRRSVLAGGRGSVVVDLVLERVPQGDPDKAWIGSVRVDTPQEILANKLNTLLSRSEERDLVDVMCLERAGYPVEQALELALAKDGACTPAALAWILSQVTIPPGHPLPAEVVAEELAEYVRDLAQRLVQLASPDRGT